MSKTLVNMVRAKADEVAATLLPSQSGLSTGRWSVITELQFEVIDSHDMWFRVHLHKIAQPISMRVEQLRDWHYFHIMVEVAIRKRLVPMTNEEWLKLLDRGMVRPGKVHMHGAALRVQDE